MQDIIDRVNIYLNAKFSFETMKILPSKSKFLVHLQTKMSHESAEQICTPQ